MRVIRLMALSVFALSCTTAATSHAQSTSTSAPHKRVLGYQDPETGTFQPLIRALPDTSTSPTTGTVELTLTISLKTALPKGGTVVCSAYLYAYSQNLSNYTVTDWSEEAYSLATVSGSTATCTVNVPYSWIIPVNSSNVSNTFSGDYLVEMLNATNVSPALIRTSLGPFVAGAIPATGSTTKYTLSLAI